MRILAINCGSSSIKSALIDSASGARLLDLRVTGIGGPAPVLRLDRVDRAPEDCRDMGTATSALLREMRSRLRGDLAPAAVVHRIVHGGERFRGATLVDERMTEELRKPRPPGAPAQSARARGAATSARVVSRRPARGGLRYRVPRHLAQAGARVRVARSHPHRLRRAPVWLPRVSHAHVMTQVAARLATTPQSLAHHLLPSRQRRERRRHRVRSQRRDQHGDDAARRPGDGHARR